MKEKNPIEGSSKLKYSFKLKSELLGFSANATIGGVKVSVTLPDFSYVSGKFKPKLPETSKIEWTGYYSDEPFNSNFPWGNIQRHNKNLGISGVRDFSVKRLYFESEKITEAEGKSVLHAIEDWCDNLITWLEVYCQTDLSDNNVEVQQHAANSTLVTISDENKKEIQCKHAVHIWTSIESPLSINKGEWQSILDIVSTGKKPPESHLFLSDALKMINAKRYRRSVLDSATAAEIALIEMRDNTLVGVDEKVSDYVKLKAEQIYNLVQYLKKSDVDLPDKIKEEIAEPRNKSIHFGVEPDEVVARNCLNKAREVSHRIFPLDKILGS